LILKLGVPILLLFAAGCASESPIVVRGVRFDRERLSHGQQLYIQYCASCHGANGEGQFPTAPNQPDTTGRIGAPPHNGAGHTWHHGDELLFRYVYEGGMGDPEHFYPMPAFRDQLAEDDIWAVIAYLKTLWNEEQRANQQRVTEAEAGG
jgi:mono/diheme cytochrome c family protein